MRSLAALLALSLTLSAHAERRRAVTPAPRNEGLCVVRGLANLYYSNDGGKTWSGNAATPVLAGVSDIAVLDTEPESVVAVSGRNVFDSQDAGCSWTLRYTIGEEIKHAVTITPASGGRAYLSNEEFLLRYDRGEVIVLQEPAPVGGLGVNPGNREHVRILTAFEVGMYESFDGGATWRRNGSIQSGSVQAAAFTANDFDHIVVAVQNRGITITQDAGRTWRTGPAGTYCDIGFGGGRSDILWATIPVQSGPWVLRSSDGGSTFAPIAGADGAPNGVCLTMVVNPHDANLTAISIPQREVHVFDAAARSASSLSCCGARTVRIAHSPKNPARMYAWVIP